MARRHLLRQNRVFVVLAVVLVGGYLHLLTLAVAATGRVLFAWGTLTAVFFSIGLTGLVREHRATLGRRAAVALAVGGCTLAVTTIPVMATICTTSAGGSLQLLPRVTWIGGVSSLWGTIPLPWLSMVVHSGSCSVDVPMFGHLVGYVLLGWGLWNDPVFEVPPKDVSDTRTLSG